MSEHWERENMWWIISRDMPDEYWSNIDGWCDSDHATLFREDETKTFSLPIGGKWSRADIG